MTFDLNINFTSFMLSGLLAFVMGVLWYHPKMMGGRWQNAQGEQIQRKAPSPLVYIASFFLWTLSACFYAVITSFLGVNTPEGYFCVACLLWVAFALPPTIMGAMNTGYPFEAMANDAAYQLGGYYIFAAVHIAFLQAGIL